MFPRQSSAIRIVAPSDSQTQLIDKEDKEREKSKQGAVNGSQVSLRSSPGDRATAMQKRSYSWVDFIHCPPMHS